MRCARCGLQNDAGLTRCRRCSFALVTQASRPSSRETEHGSEMAARMGPKPSREQARGQAAVSRRPVVLKCAAAVLLIVTGAGATWVAYERPWSDEPRSQSGAAADPSVPPRTQRSTVPMPVSSDDLERAIGRRIIVEGGDSPRSVVCPQDLQPALGETSTCRVVDGGGDDLTVSVRTTSLDGGTVQYGFAIDPALLEVPSPSPKETPSYAEQVRTAGIRLEKLRLQDVARLPLDGRWAAQLSSKSEGIVDPLQLAANGSHTFRGPDILKEHLILRSDSRFADSDIVLVTGSDFGQESTYNGKPFWITLALRSFSSSADVIQWCAANFPLLSGDELSNSCLPRSLDPPTGP